MLLWFLRKWSLGFGRNEKEIHRYKMYADADLLMRILIFQIGSFYNAHTLFVGMIPTQLVLSNVI
jgi:hypothetical protein